MSDYLKQYEFWKTSPIFDEATRAEIAALTDPKEIEDRFYKDLEFGTGGARGIMGAGTNRMNIYNIRKITAGFSTHIIKKFGAEAAEKQGVAVAYDPRNHSKEFAKAAALTFAAYGIKVYLYTVLSATPLLSFTVRDLKCVGGVVVTASHNPKEYNGYKAYDETGCQLYPDDADSVTAEVEKIAIPDIRTISEEDAAAKGLLFYIGYDEMHKFTEEVKKFAHPISKEAKENLKIVYTPMYGAGNVPVRNVLKELGYTNVNVVKEQELPDGDFPSVTSPNPGDEGALELARKLAAEIDADIVVGSDPDSDRIGMSARGKDGKFIFYSGNQICGMLIDYVLMQNKAQLTDKSALITTVVTSELGTDIAKSYGLKVYEVLTGFKFIGKKQDELEKAGIAKIEFGYEESNGCLIGDYARDKDSVVAIMLMCEMAAYYKEKGIEIADILENIYKRFGFYLDHLDSLVFKGKEGAEKIKAINAKIRSMGASFAPDVAAYKDFAPGIEGLPPSDVLKFWFTDGSWMAIRPSGTEPKIKIYYCIHNNDKAAAQARLEEIQARVNAVVDSIE